MKKYFIQRFPQRAVQPNGLHNLMLFWQPGPILNRSFIQNIYLKVRCLLSSRQTFPQKKSLKVEIDILRGKYFFLWIFPFIVEAEASDLLSPGWLLHYPQNIDISGAKVCGKCNFGNYVKPLRPGWGQWLGYIRSHYDGRHSLMFSPDPD